MSLDKTNARIIVVGNEKGGSGKSTVAMHIAVALMKSGRRVATIDLDVRQKSFTHYIENRRAWAATSRRPAIFVSMRTTRPRTTGPGRSPRPSTSWLPTTTSS